jgi:hypothetical protein
MSLGCTVQTVHQIAYSHAVLHPFDGFIRTLWAMREAFEAKGDVRAFFAKLLMNSLYGRLGMGSKMEKKIVWQQPRGTTFKSQKKDAWYTEEGELYLEREYTTYAKPTWTNVLWAAQITSYARIRLHAHLLAQSAGLVYTDTDSIISLNPIIGTGYGLGQLRATGDYQSAIVVGPKLYSLQDNTGEWHTRAKGIPSGAAFDFLTQGVATFSAPVNPSQQLRKGVRAGTWIDMRREHHYTPARRQPTNPAALESQEGWSDTSPVWFGPEGE